MNNVCKFLPPPRTAHPLQTINFVYETHPQSIPPCPHATTYRVHLVTRGEGEVHLGNAVAHVKAGDVFFTLPAMPFEILADHDMRYLYISYVGIRAAAETERCGIHANRFVFENLSELEPIWLHALAMDGAPTDLATEAVLLHTLAAVGSRLPIDTDTAVPNEAGVNFSLIKQYIDEHFCDPSLCGDSISLYFSYNKKYISTLFKKHMKLGISEYIRMLRLNRATELLEKGGQSVSEISQAVGFRDALYFSKLFKLHMGASPKKYLSKKQ